MPDQTYPEHAKLRLVSEHTQAVGEFLSWAAEQGMEICYVQDGRPCCTPVTELLATWQGIDLAELEREKRAMLSELREESSLA